MALSLKSLQAPRRDRALIFTIIADEPKERDVEEYDLATADFEEYTITLQIPENIFKNLGFAPCKIKADLSPLSLLGANRRAEVERKLKEVER